MDNAWANFQIVLTQEKHKKVRDRLLDELAYLQDELGEFCLAMACETDNVQDVWLKRPVSWASKKDGKSYTLKIAHVIDDVVKTITEITRIVKDPF